MGLSGPWLGQRGAHLASETRAGRPTSGLPSRAPGLGGDGRKPSIQTSWPVRLGPHFCLSSLSHRNAIRPPQSHGYHPEETWKPHPDPKDGPILALDPLAMSR